MLSDKTEIMPLKGLQTDNLRYIEHMMNSQKGKPLVV